MRTRYACSFPRVPLDHSKIGEVQPKRSRARYFGNFLLTVDGTF